MRSIAIAGCLALILSLQAERSLSGIKPRKVFRVAAPSQVQEAAAGEQEDAPLPGGSAPLDEDARSCKGSVVARLIRLGPSDVGSPCMSDYTETEWEIVEVLRGKYLKVMRLSLSVPSCPALSRVRLPSEGQTYILLSSSVSKFQIGRMVEYSADNLKNVRSVLRARTRSNYRFNRTRLQHTSYLRSLVRAD